MTTLLRWFLLGFACGLGLLTGIVSSQDNLGASYIGFCHPRWPCDQSLKVFDGVPVKRLGFLAPPTFGRTCPCYRRFQHLPGPKYVRVHLANGTCFRERGRVCQPGEPFAGETVASADRKLRRRNPGLLRRYRHNALKLKAVLTPDPFTIERLALCLECPVSGPARRALLRVAREVFPDGVFVDSVLTQGCLKGLVCERHGSRPRLSPPCVADLDGRDAREVDVAGFARRTAGCEASFVWARPFNLLPPDPSTGFVSPRARTAAPTRADFDFLRALLAP
ncbi:MAG: hypothetical protein K2X87_30905 [Gemmataceae bacterium]|nr:hypothetical protein [Gemmataceae bacterium]